MATPIVLPSLGMYTAEGTVVGWLKADGARVTAGEAVVEIETEKAVNPIVAPSDGRLQQVASVGATVKEQELLAYILAEGEGLMGSETKVSAPGAVETTVPAAVASNVGGGAQEFIKASPIARRLAAQHGIELAQIRGSGPGGRVLERDVEAHVAARNTGVQKSTEAGGAGDEPSRGRRTPLTSMRRTIGERLARTQKAAIPLTLMREGDAEVLVLARVRLSEKLGSPVPYEAFFVKLWAEILREHPELNATIEGDDLVACDHVHIGFAVAVPGGLYVPVVRDAERASVEEIAGQIKRLAGKARAGELTGDEMAGGTTTITNLGGVGVDAFTPVLNPPQSSILGIGRIAPRAVVRDGTVMAGRTCWLSLTFDHRVTDGAPAGAALEALANRMLDEERIRQLT